MESKKITAYLLYAIGEIVLVVIGILIAVNINERAAYQRERNDEIAILKEIRANLDNDLTEIDQDLWAISVVRAGFDTATNYLRNRNAPDKVFGQAVNNMGITPHFKKNLSGYDLLTSKGIKIIQKDSLRRAISNLFETEYDYYERYELERIDFVSNQLDPIKSKYFLWIEEPDNQLFGYYQTSQENFNKLKSDDTFLNLISLLNQENALAEIRARS